MSHHTLIWIWTCGLALQAILAIVLFARKMWKRFTFFTLYLLVNLAMSGIVFVIHLYHTRDLFYFYSFWIEQGIVLILGLAVLFEVFSLLFTPYPALKKLAVQAFQWTLAFLVVFGIIVIYAQPNAEPSQLSKAFLLVEEAFRIIELGLVAGLLVFASVFGLHWRQYSFGIIVGMGTFATLQLVAVALRSYTGLSSAGMTNALGVLDFDISLLIWLVYLMAPELTANGVEPPHREQLEQWNKALTELIYQ